MQQNVIFSYWHDDKFKGFIADEFGTITMHKPLISEYEEEDIQCMIESVQDAMCNRYAGLSSKLFKACILQVEDYHRMHQSISRTQQTIRGWKDFEVRIHSFDTENYIELELKEISTPLEVLKFRVVDNEN